MIAVDKNPGTEQDARAALFISRHKKLLCEYGYLVGYIETIPADSFNSRANITVT